MWYCWGMSDPVEFEVYQSQNGRRPYLEWEEGLDRTTRIKIVSHLNRLRMGNFGSSKSLKGGIYEVKVQFGAGYRVYYGKRGKHLVILLCGGDKGSQKKDIKMAREYWDDYLARKQGRH